MCTVGKVTKRTVFVLMRESTTAKQTPHTQTLSLPSARACAARATQIKSQISRGDEKKVMEGVSWKRALLC